MSEAGGFVNVKPNDQNNNNNNNLNTNSDSSINIQDNEPPFIEINDEIVFIKQNTDVINVSKFIYEFFLLSIPLKRIHPSVVNENNIDNFVFSTKKKKENNIDPRFEKLKKL